MEGTLSYGDLTNIWVSIPLNNLKRTNRYIIPDKTGYAASKRKVHIEVTSDEIRDALSDPIAEVVEAIKTSLEKTPPELAADIVDNGIILAGGGSLLANLDVLIKEKTGLPVSLAEDPLTSVVRGCGKALESIHLLRQVTTLS